MGLLTLKNANLLLRDLWSASVGVLGIWVCEHLPFAMRHVSGALPNSTKGFSSRRASSPLGH
jgi:hypothetical protein